MGPLTHCMALLYFFITFLLFLNHLLFVPLFPGQNCPGENRSSQPQLLWGCEKFFTWVENNKYTKTRQKNYNLKTQLICSNDHICQCKHTTIGVTLIYYISLLLSLIQKTKQNINAALAEPKILHGVISPDLYRKQSCKLTCAGHWDSFSFHVVVGNQWGHQSTAESKCVIGCL